MLVHRAALDRHVALNLWKPLIWNWSNPAGGMTSSARCCKVSSYSVHHSLGAQLRMRTRKAS
jgi:hypothetical protein